MVASSPPSYSPLFYICTAVIILDSEGNRILGKYYEHDEPLSTSKKAQTAFEAALFQRTRKALTGILLSVIPTI